MNILELSLCTAKRSMTKQCSIITIKQTASTSTAMFSFYSTRNCLHVSPPAALTFLATLTYQPIFCSQVHPCVLFIAFQLRCFMRWVYSGAHYAENNVVVDLSLCVAVPYLRLNHRPRQNWRRPTKNMDRRVPVAS